MNKYLFLAIIIHSLLNCHVIAQDKYQLSQVTTRPGEAGFFDWSPDGLSIAYTRPNGIWKFHIDEGIPKQIITNQAQHPDWSPDGNYIVFDSDSGKTISVTSAAGGVPIRINPETTPIINSGYPLWTPDGAKVLYQGEQYALYLLEVQTGKITKFTEFEHLIPVPKSWSPTGNELLLSLRDNSKREANLWMVSRTGSKTQLTYDGKSGYRDGDISPDGSFIVYSLYKDHKIWIMPLEGGRSMQLTFSEDARDSDPKFSPDGKWIAFRRNISGTENIWILKFDMDATHKELELLNQQ